MTDFQKRAKEAADAWQRLLNMGLPPCEATPTTDERLRFRLIAREAVLFVQEHGPTALAALRAVANGRWITETAGHGDYRDAFVIEVPNE